MVLVTLGTQSQSFYRLLDAIENSHIDDEIIVQAGGSDKYKSKKMKIFKFISYEEMNDLIDRCDYIITHGGTGSIFMPLKKGKKIIACARLEKYKEHINNHQLEVVNLLSDEGYILEYKENDDLDEIVKKIKKFKPKKYISNKEHFIECIKKEIDD